MHTVLESDIVPGGFSHPALGMSALLLTGSSTSPKIVHRAHRPILDLIEGLTLGRFSVKPFSPSAHGDSLSVTVLRGPTAGRATVVVIPRHRGRNRK